MTLEIGTAIRTGLDRLGKRNGLLLIALIFLVNAASGTLGTSVTGFLNRMSRFAQSGQVTDPIEIFAVGVGTGLATGLAGLLSFLLWIASILLTIAAIRILVSDETEHIPSTAFTHNAGWAFLNFVVGTFLFAIAVGLGFVLFVVPGVFLLVTLAFWAVFVTVEDQNFVEGFRNSWKLTRGSRLQILLLGLGVMLVSFVIAFLFGIPSGLLGGTVGALVAEFGTAVTTVFATAVLAQAYNQLRAEREDRFVETERASPTAESAESA
jgi:hypothetical protein